VAHERFGQALERKVSVGRDRIVEEPDFVQRRGGV